MKTCHIVENFWNRLKVDALERYLSQGANARKIPEAFRVYLGLSDEKMLQRKFLNRIDIFKRILSLIKAALLM